MKKLTMAALAIGLVAMSSLAFAQAEPHDVGIFADAGGTMSDRGALDFVPFDFFVVGFDLDGGILGYEFGVTIPPTFTLLTATLTGPAPLNVGNNTNVIVGTGGCVSSVAGGVVLTTYNGGFFAPGTGTVADQTFCIGSASPSSFANVPGYLQCDNTLVPFGVAQNGEGRYPNACLVLNATQPGPVAVEPTNFGDLKARF